MPNTSTFQRLLRLHQAALFDESGSGSGVAPIVSNDNGVISLVQHGRPTFPGLVNDNGVITATPQVA